MVAVAVAVAVAVRGRGRCAELNDSTSNVCRRVRLGHCSWAHCRNVGRQDVSGLFSQVGIASWQQYMPLSDA